MASQTFCIVDVFAEEKYAGNQLAVFQDAAGLSQAQMQRLAKEMNYSETTFILSATERDGGYDVRIFTPEEELPFAGHPTLGTAYVIQHDIIKAPVPQVTLNLPIGQIPVALQDQGKQTDILWMQQQSPTFGRTYTPEMLAPVLNLDVSAFETRYPIQEVSTGLPFFIVPLQTHDALKQARTARDAYDHLVRDSEAKSLLLFFPETYHQDHDLRVRVFADYFGVPEDPATGSANGCLAGYLIQHRYFGQDRIDIRVEQGYEIGRPSLLYLRAHDQAGSIAVSVGGKVVMVAQGHLV